jgi:hypothetical protein
MNEYRIDWVEDISEVEREQWDRLALPLETPFLEWRWLRLLERSGSVGRRSGWLPMHLTVWSGSRLVGAAPLYIKLHSSGEFVFDHLWADVAEQLGVPYYPKLLGMSPFTPMVGYRFLIDPEHREQDLTDAMIRAIDQLCSQYGLSGCHFNFVQDRWRRQMEGYGFKTWEHQRYIWENEGFRTFDDYLARFKTNQRRNIKRERRSMADQGVRIELVEGADIHPGILDRMYAYYVRTNEQFGPWACKFLNKSFFDALGSEYRDRLLIIAAYGQDSGEPVGMSLLVHKGDKLYGRYWGGVDTISNLHFNLCYYSPIEWAIDRGINLFDPGLGGMHKMRRGFRSVSSHSLHRFRDRRLQSVLQTYIGEINRVEREQIQALNRRLPFADGEWG